MTPFDLEVLKPSMQGRVIANENIETKHFERHFSFNPPII